MAKKSLLDQKLLTKMAAKRNGNQLAMRKAISARAGKLHIPLEVAQVIMAHELGIRTAVHERSLGLEARELIRSFSTTQSTYQVPIVKHTNLIRRRSVNKPSHKRPWWENPWLLAVGSIVIGGLILAYIFGVGR